MQVLSKVQSTLQMQNGFAPIKWLLEELRWLFQTLTLTCDHWINKSPDKKMTNVPIKMFTAKRYFRLHSDVWPPWGLKPLQKLWDYTQKPSVLEQEEYFE